MTEIKVYNLRKKRVVDTSLHDILMKFSGVINPIDQSVVINFISDLSRGILKNASLRDYADIIVFASWFRKQRLLHLIDENLNSTKGHVFRGRGTIFVISPSNVEMIAFYNLLISLICGNRTIVKISSKSGEVTQLIVQELEKLFQEKPEYLQLLEYFELIAYENDDYITSALSNICDVRSIWGGDKSIKSVRRNALAERAIDLSFADRFSCALIEEEFYTNLDNIEKSKVINKILIDLKEFVQQGCSSPKVFYWITKCSKRCFINEFHSLLEARIREIDLDIDLHEQLISSALLASGAKLKKTEDNNSLMSLILTDEKDLSHIRSNHQGNMVIVHHIVQGIDEFIRLLHPKDQTLTILARDEALFKREIITKSNMLDRIVPVGSALDFCHVWDGVNLFHSYSKLVRI